MDEVSWEEPPRVTRGRSRAAFMEVADKLRANPGVWACIARYGKTGSAGSIAAHISKGRYDGIEPGEFEAVSRNVDGEFRVYARYVGVPTAAPTGETTAAPGTVTIG